MFLIVVMEHFFLFCLTTHHHDFHSHKNTKHMENEKKNSVWRISVGIILTPILISIYFSDKILLVFLPHIQSETIMKWFGNIDKIGQSLLRLIAVLFVYFVAKFFIWLF